AQKNISVVSQPPYSPELKTHLKGHHFDTTENVKAAVTDQLKVIRVFEFQHCYKDCKQCLRRCVTFQGNYFE
ncbi:hypothetical protein EAG_16229, partial [Camponotus floridanus]